MVSAGALRWWIPAAVVALACFAVYGRSIGYQFLDWDDNINVYQNVAITQPSWGRFAALWTRPYGELYVPLVYTSYLLDMFVGGGWPGLFHVGNIVLHVVSGTSVYYLLRQVLRSDHAALMGALLFVVHPLQVESVAWVTGRKDVLSGALMLLSLACFSRWSDSRVRAWYALATACFVLSLFAKPSAVVVPAMALALGFHKHHSRRELAVWLAPWFVAAAAWAAVTMLIQSSAVRADAPFVASPWQRPFVAADCLVFYAGKVLFPVNLVPIYPRTVEMVLASPWKWFSLLAVAVTAIGLWRLRGVTALASSWFVIPVLPVLGFTTFFYQYFSSVADRYTYVALAGVALGAGGFYRWARSHRPRMTPGIACAGILVLGGMSFAQAGHWASSETLWRRELSLCPGNLHARQNLAANLALQGRFAESRAEFERVIAADSGYAKAYSNLIRLNQQLHDARGLEYIAARARLLPADSVDAYMARGQAALALGEYKEAAPEFRGALAGAPEDADAWNGLGAALIGSGDDAKAREAVENALSLIPRMPPAQANLGILLAVNGNYSAALRMLMSAAEMLPDNQEYAEVAAMVNRAAQTGMPPRDLRGRLRPFF